MGFATLVLYVVFLCVHVGGAFYKRHRVVILGE